MCISQALVSVCVKVRVKIVELRNCVPFLVHTGDSACLLFLLPKMMSSCVNTYVHGFPYTAVCCHREAQSKPKDLKRACHGFVCLI